MCEIPVDVNIDRSGKIRTDGVFFCYSQFHDIAVDLQKGVEKNLSPVEAVDFAERGRSTAKAVGVGRSVIPRAQ